MDFMPQAEREADEQSCHISVSGFNSEGKKCGLTYL